jgi:hypothetical protein
MADFDIEQLTPVDPVEVEDAGYDTESYAGVSLSELSESVPPVLTVISPAHGGPIAPDEDVHVTITDNAGDLAGVFLWLVIDVDGDAISDVETIWDGDRFALRYGASTMGAIANGFEFYLRRASGWEATPTFKYRCFDSSGNEAPPI